MIPRVLEAGVSGPYSLRSTFNAQSSKTVNVLPLLDGPIFEPLRDPAYFATVVLDPTCGAVVWPNGADFAPEALHDLKAEREKEIERAVRARATTPSTIPPGQASCRAKRRGVGY